jgi:hypothetical protein
MMAKRAPARRYTFRCQHRGRVEMVEAVSRASAAAKFIGHAEFRFVSSTLETGTYRIETVLVTITESDDTMARLRMPRARPAEVVT